MGEAFDAGGAKLGEATGATRSEVLKVLEDRFGDQIAEVRIRRRKMLPAEEINERFTYHKPFGNQQERYQTLRELARQLAHAIHVLCPDSREKSTAQTKLQEVVMWANASIAINEAEPESIPAVTQQPENQTGSTAVLD